MPLKRVTVASGFLYYFCYWEKSLNISFAFFLADVLIALVSLYGTLISSKHNFKVNLRDLKSPEVFYFVLNFLSILCEICSPEGIMLFKTQTFWKLLREEIFWFWFSKILYERGHCFFEIVCVSRRQYNAILLFWFSLLYSSPVCTIFLCVYMPSKVKCYYLCNFQL